MRNQITSLVQQKEKAQEVVEEKMEEAEEKGFKSCTKTKKNGEAERNIGAMVLPATLKNTVPKSGAYLAISLEYESTMLYETNKANASMDWEDNKEKRREKENQERKERRKKGNTGNPETMSKTKRVHQTRREMDTKMEWSSNW